MRRRDVIKAIATSAAAWQLSVRAQPLECGMSGVLLALLKRTPRRVHASKHSG